MPKVVAVHADEEDRLLTDDVVSLVVGVHGLSDYDIYRHIMIDRLECDVIIRGVIRRAYRTIGIELKETDVVKVAKQALARKHLFNYMYIVVNLRSCYTIRWLYKRKLLDVLLRNGIGIITFEDGSPFLVVKSMFNPRPKYKPSVPLTSFMDQP